MASSRFLALLVISVSTGAMAEPPELYRQSAYESPVRAAPDDLLFLAGDGLAADDVVVYRAVRDTTKPLATPDLIPHVSDAEFGVAPIVSWAGTPYSVTIKMPEAMRADQSYALWVRTARGEWSRPVKINDARPLWATPTYVYASGMPASLPRELKIVGRNLRPSTGHLLLVRLLGPQRFTGVALTDAQAADPLNEYVARVRLPTVLATGSYRILVNRDGVSWVDIADQRLTVLRDLPANATFSVNDSRFGGCRPDDGLDDTACIVRAIDAAAHAGSGTVNFGAGTWDLIESNQPELVGDEGVVVPAGVQLRGAGSASTRISRHAEWNVHRPTAAFTLVGNNEVSGFTFGDLQGYHPTDRAGPFLQIGENWQRVASAPGSSTEIAVVSNVIVTRNIFDKPDVAIGVGGIPVDRLFVTYNVFGAYNSALELGGDKYDMVYKYRLDDSVIDYNVFKPGSKLDVVHKTGTIASEVGAGYRLDFSGNTADGAATDYLYTANDARGWRAAFFWNANNNAEKVLVSQNTATCTGDKIGDGEAIVFDNNTNTFPFGGTPTVTQAAAGSVAVAAPLAARQNDRDVPVATYYIGHWIQVVSGPGLGQVRKIIGYSTDPATHVTHFSVAPDWDVVPVPHRTAIAIGREYWQVYVVDNRIDNRRPLCQKSNRSRRAGGSIGMWAQSADSSIAGNLQYDSDGIFVQQNYAFAKPSSELTDHPCADCTMVGFFNFFLDIRDNTVDGEYDWNNDCSSSGIGIGVAAAPWATGALPLTIGFGVAISHNVIRRADGEYGGAIAQMNTWETGPEPHRWPLSDNLLIHHNSISDIDGSRALALCGKSRARSGISFPEPAIAWRTVLYANSCKNVSMPLNDSGVDTVKVCPASVTDSCECPRGD